MTELRQHALPPHPYLGSARLEQDMHHNTPASGRQRHRELSPSFALVAPLGGGAVMALHAPQQAARKAPSWGAVPPRRQRPLAEAAAAPHGGSANGLPGFAWS